MTKQTPMNKYHWAAHKERGSLVSMTLTAACLRRLGRRPMAPVLFLIVPYFFIFDRRARHNVRQYLDYRIAWSGHIERRPSRRRLSAPLMAFGNSLLDRLDVWHGRLKHGNVTVHDPLGGRERIIKSRHSGRGEMLIGSHLGNIEVCRALAELGEQVPLDVLVHTSHVAHFNRLQSVAGEHPSNPLQVRNMNVALMLDLSQRPDRGQWLAIAGDRVPLQSGRRVVVDFLGHAAPFTQVPRTLAGLLRRQVNLMCCLKIGIRNPIHLEPFIGAPQRERSQREALVKTRARRYADRLAQKYLLAPLQWFHFHPYGQRAVTPTLLEKPMRSQGVLHHDTEVLVPFFDVDSMNVVWHGHYVKYLEIARCALLEKLGHTYGQMKQSGYVWPVIDVQLRYVQPARFGQLLRVRADLVEWRNRLKIHYLISDADSGERLTRASTVQVAVSLADGSMQLASPQVMVEAIERHLP